MSTHRNLHPFVLVALGVGSFLMLSPVFRTDAGSPQAGKIGAHLGYSKAAEADDGNGLLGGHLEVMPAPFLGIRGSVDYRLVESFSIETGNTEGSFDVRSVPVIAEGRLYVPGVTVRPFFGLGAGWYFIKYDYSEVLEAVGFRDDWENSFGWHMAAGAEVGLTPVVSVYGEARAVFLDPDHSLDSETTDQVTDLDYDSTYFAAGFNLAF